jgi:hypothetical protein
MMITVAVAAVALALISARWNRPPIVDPFDAVEMLGPDPKPLPTWKRDESGKADASVFPISPSRGFRPERIR